MNRRLRQLLPVILGLSTLVAHGEQPASDPYGQVAAPNQTAGAADFVIFANGFETGDIVLPFGSTNRMLTVQFSPVDPAADLVLSIDTTGSMGGEISNVQSGLSSIITSARALVPDTSIAVASWRDFPVAPFGNAGDSPWQLRLSTTSNTALAQAALASLAAAGGGDLAESGYEALYQLGTGAGISYPGGSVPAYTGPGLGGVGFRAGSLRMVLHITDASSHLDTDYPVTIPDPHSRSEAFAALAALGVRVIPILSDNMVPTDTQLADTQLQEAASVSGAEVPPCGFTRPAGCAIGQCCTALNGAGEPPNTSGRCPLRFRISSAGTGIGPAITGGIQAVVKYGTHQVIAGATDDGSPATLDTTCFIDRIEADAFLRPPQEPEASCVPEATPVAIGGAGYNDGFTNLATGSAGGSAGSALQFVVQLSNLCAPQTAMEQVFVVNLDLTDTVTGEVMDTRTLTVVVPASP